MRVCSFFCGMQKPSQRGRARFSRGELCVYLLILPVPPPETVDNLTSGGFIFHSTE